MGTPDALRASAPPFRSMGKAVFAAAGLAAMLALASCTADPLVESYAENNGQTAESVGTDRVAEFPESRRGESIQFEGRTEDGSHFDSTAEAGKVIVVNFWFATCGPCRVEASSLEGAWKSSDSDEVTFVGVNIDDGADVARSFAKEFGVTYPSILDAQSGSARLDFAAVTPLQATPSTLVLDREGRVAAQVLGPLDGPSVLETLIADVAAE